MNQQTSERDNERTLRFSVIVPVYNHWHLVPTLLECLAQQTLSQDEFETIVVDNASDTFEPPEALPANSKIFTCDTPGSYAARNHGIEKARGRWLVFTDADCRPRPDWLENLFAAQNKRTSERANKRTILAGAIHMISESDTPNRYEIYDLVRGIPQAWYVRRGYAATANLAVPAALMERLGGFDARRVSGGDAEMCRRAVKQGASLKYVADAVVVHPARSTQKEVIDKVRRIKAGQVAAGDWPRRIRSLIPPFIEIWKYLRADRWPWKYRLIAAAVQMQLWPVEFKQAFFVTISSKGSCPAHRKGF